MEEINGGGGGDSSINNLNPLPLPPPPTLLSGGANSNARGGLGLSSLPPPPTLMAPCNSVGNSNSTTTGATTMSYIAKTKYVPIPTHSSSGFNAAHGLNGDTDSDDDEDDALGRMVYNSSRTAQIRAVEAAAAMAEEAAAEAEAAAAMAEEVSYDVSPGLINTSSSSHHHQLQLEGTAPGLSTSANKSSSSATKVVIPNENDVLFGRGSISDYPGNKHYRSLVKAQKSTYLSANLKIEKRAIAESIMQQLNNLHPPGRFITEDRSGLGHIHSTADDDTKRYSHPLVSNKVWVQVSDDLAIDKIMHGLREKEKKKKTCGNNNENKNVARTEKVARSNRSNGSNGLAGNEEDVITASIRYNNYSAASASAGRTFEEDAKNQMIMKLYQQMMVKHVSTSLLDKTNEEDGESAIEGSPVRGCSRPASIKKDLLPPIQSTDKHNEDTNKKIVYPGDHSSRKSPPLDEGCNKFVHKGGTFVDNKAADTLATLANSTHMYSNDKSTCGAKRKSAVNDEHKWKGMDKCNIYASPPEIDYSMSQYNRYYRPGVNSGSQSYQYQCPTPALLGMTNHDNPYYYQHAMMYSGSQSSARAKVARPQSNISNNEDDSGSDDERGRMIHTSSRTVRERRAVAAETTNNNDIQSKSLHKSGSDDESTITTTTGTKRKSDSVQDDHHQKKRVYKICSTDGCPNQVKKGGVCCRHGASVVRKICSIGTKRKSDSVQDDQKKKKKVRKTCSIEGCSNIVVRGGKCCRHGAKRVRKICSTDGCTNYVQKEGVCIRHGAMVKICSTDGCTNNVVKGGVCIRHGAKKKKSLYSKN